MKGPPVRVRASALCSLQGICSPAPRALYTTASGPHNGGAAGDVNGEGWPDLVSVEYAAKGVTVFVNSRDGFEPGVRYRVRHNASRNRAVPGCRGLPLSGATGGSRRSES